MNVLVVDDLDFIRMYTRKVIEQKYGFSVTEAENGNTALNLIQNNNFNIVISDYELPDVTGWHIYEKIANSYPETYFILMSGNYSVFEKHSVPNALFKPFKQKDIHSIIDKFLLHTPRAKRYNLNVETDIEVIDTKLCKINIVNISQSGALLASKFHLPPIFKLKIKEKTIWCDIVRYTPSNDAHYYGIRFTPMIDDITLKHLIQPYPSNK